MKIQIITLFPEMFEGVLNNSMMWKAQNRSAVEFSYINLRDYGMSEDEYLRAEHLITGTQSRAYNPLAYLVNKRNGLYHINR